MMSVHEWQSLLYSCNLLLNAVFLFVLIVWIVTEIVSWIYVIIDTKNGNLMDERIREIVQEEMGG